MFSWLKRSQKQKMEAAPEPVAEKGLATRLQQGLQRTRQGFVSRIDRLFSRSAKIDDALLDELEEILITSDLGVRTTMDLLDHLRQQVKKDKVVDSDTLRKLLRERLLSYLQQPEQAEQAQEGDGPTVVMVVGVNGVGKTTTIGKLASRAAALGSRVMLVAGDTFRAAAVDQLKIWGERSGVAVIAQQENADPSAVVFDALGSALAHKHDLVLIDTAGRLHTKTNLMEELKKIKRVTGKRYPGAPHEILLVLDATTGQNSISQTRLFNEAVGVTGIAVTKMDGTAKGGIVVNIAREFAIPIRYIGVGEGIEDLQEFDAVKFVAALFEQ